MLAGQTAPSRRTSRRWLIGSTAAGALGAAAPFALRRAAPSKPVPAEGQRSYELGQQFAERRTQEGLANAVKEYEKALSVAPEFADAWTGLADAYSAMANFNFMEPRAGLDKAREAAIRAVELKPDSGRAQGVLAYVISIDLRRWLTAEPYFRRAVELDPAEPMLRVWYGGHLGKRSRFEEAIAQVKLGLARYPGSFPLNHQLAAEYFRARRMGECLEQSQELVRIQPYEVIGHLMLARALEWTGRYNEALKACSDAERYGSDGVAICHRACILAISGDRAKASLLALAVEKRWKSTPFETLLLAQLFARLRGPQDVLAVLNTGLERGDSTVLSAPTSPYLQQWQSSPEFQAFSRRLGLAV